MAIGVDKAENGEYYYTFQTANPSSYETDKDESALKTDTVSAQTLYAAMDRINTNTPKKIDCSHIKLLIFSESCIKSGIEKEMTAIFKSSLLHPNTRVAMSLGSAAEYLEKTSLPLGTNPAEYYENIFKPDYTSIIPDVRLKDIVNKYDSENPCCVLPIVAPNKTLESMAILKNYKLCATAERDDVISYNLLTQNGFSFNMYVKYPDEQSNTVVEIKETRKRIRTYFPGSAPQTDVNIALEGSVLWSEKPGAYSDEPESFRKLLQSELTDQITCFLNNCSRKYRADILNLQKGARANYLTVTRWQNENRSLLFENSDYNVNVTLAIKREGMNGVEK